MRPSLDSAQCKSHELHFSGCGTRIDWLTDGLGVPISRNHSNVKYPTYGIHHCAGSLSRIRMIRAGTPARMAFVG